MSGEYFGIIISSFCNGDTETVTIETVTGTARGQIDHFVHVGWTVSELRHGSGRLTCKVDLGIIILNSR
jgi:hypothetical protein